MTTTMTLTTHGAKTCRTTVNVNKRTATASSGTARNTSSELAMVMRG